MNTRKRVLAMRFLTAKKLEDQRKRALESFGMISYTTRRRKMDTPKMLNTSAHSKKAHKPAQKDIQAEHSSSDALDNSHELHDPYANLYADEVEEINAIKKDIDTFYREIPDTLKASPEAQSQCLNYLLDASSNLAKPQVDRSDIINSRMKVIQVAIELEKAKSSRKSFFIVVALVYLFIGLIVLGFQFDIFSSVTADEINKQIVMGIPLPVWIWSIIGSLTSMLFRAGQFPFVDFNEALRWIFFRPIVGVVMGVLTYLLVAAGLVVFTGTSTTRTPELIWVIAFIGSFSDTLSINLLERILGEFNLTKGPAKAREQEGAEQAKKAIA
jgi:hypothetical protein